MVDFAAYLLGSKYHHTPAGLMLAAASAGQKQVGKQDGKHGGKHGGKQDGKHGGE